MQDISIFIDKQQVPDAQSLSKALGSQINAWQQL